jgi:hypothetical protein
MCLLKQTPRHGGMIIFLVYVLDVDEWSISSSGRFIPMMPTEWEAGWAQSQSGRSRKGPFNP